MSFMRKLKIRANDTEGTRSAIDGINYPEGTKSTGLRRNLGAFDVTLMGIGGIIGTGIFVLTGIVAAAYAGPGIVVSFVIAGIACAFAALCYAEFAAAVPVSGSVYTYTYVTIGEFPAWLIGWVMILEYGLSISAVAVGWSGYCRQLLGGFGIHLPKAISEAPSELGRAAFTFNLPACLVILFLTFLMSRGTRTTASMNNLMVFIKLVMIGLFVMVGVFYVKPDNWSPFLPYGVKGVFSGAAVVFFAYIGFDAVSSTAEEVRRPQRDLPIGILASLAIATCLYIIVALVLTGMAPYQTLNTAAPVSFAMRFVGQARAAGVIELGAMFGMMSVMLVNLFGQTRIWYAMARDGLLPSIFAKLHAQYHTPYRSAWTIGIAASLVAGLLPLQRLAELVNIGTLAAFTLISVSVLILRRTQPDLPRPFRVPFVPVVPVLAVIFNLFLMFNLPSFTWEAFLMWALIGCIVYLLYGRWNSVMAKVLE